MTSLIFNKNKIMKKNRSTFKNLKQDGSMNHRVENNHKMFPNLAESSLTTRKTEREVTVASVQRVKSTNSFLSYSLLDHTIDKNQQEDLKQFPQIESLKKAQYKFIPKKTKKNQNYLNFEAHKQQIQRLANQIKIVLKDLASTLSSLNGYIKQQLPKQVNGFFSELSSNRIGQIQRSLKFGYQVENTEKSILKEQISKLKQKKSSELELKREQFEEIIYNYIQSIQMITGKLVSKQQDQQKSTDQDFEGQSYKNNQLVVPSIQNDKFDLDDLENNL